MDNEQKLIRAQGVTGTDIGAILGLNPYKNAYEVYLDKIDPLREIPDNLAMKLGRTLEPMVADWYSEKIGYSLNTPPTIISKENPIFRGSPDRVIPSPSKVLEIKTTKRLREGDGWGPDGSDQVPQYYAAQCYWYMMLCNMNFCDLALFIRSTEEFRLYHLVRDKELEIGLKAHALAFWERVQTKNPPDIKIDGSSKTIQYLRDRYPKNKAPLLIADEELIVLGNKYLAVTKQYDVAEEQVNLIANQIKNLLKDAEGAESEVWRCTWKNNKDSKKLDTKALVSILEKTEEGQKLITENTKMITGARVFLFKEKKSI